MVKKRWTNMAGVGSCEPQSHHHPSTEEELIQLIQSIYEKKGKCRIVGAGKSPNSCTFSNQHLIHMNKLDRIIKVDKPSLSVTCQGGVIMRRLMLVLDELGLMLRCVPSYVETTLAGCLATGTHSSGMETHGLCDYVTALTIVDGTGTKQHFSLKDDPKALRLACCHLGVLGAVIEVTLKVEKQERWHLVSSPLTFREAASTALRMQNVNRHRYYRMWWMPHTKRCYQSIGTFFNPETKKSDSVEYQKWRLQESSWSSKLWRFLKGDWLRHTVIQNSLWMACYLPFLQPFINKFYAAVFYGSRMDQYGSALDCFTFDCLFKQWANEWAIDANKAPEVLVELEKLIAKENLKLHFPVEFRFSPADETRLSPAVDRATCWVGIVMYRPRGADARDTIRCYNLFNMMMKRVGGRPHWAKYYQWGNANFKLAYGGSWGDFLQLRKKMDPQNVFVNHWFSQLVSEMAKNSTSSK